MKIKSSVILAVTTIAFFTFEWAASAQKMISVPPALPDSENAQSNITSKVPDIPSPAVSEPEKATKPETISDDIPAVKPSDEEGKTDFIALPTESTNNVEGEESGSDTNNTITIALDDVLLEDVVRMFSRISNANIIANPSNLTARVTANLDGVEWKPALSSILAMHNLALVENSTGSGVYSIVPKAPDALDPLIVKTIFLKYTTVSEVTPVVQSMLTPDRGSLSSFTSRNALVIRDTENSLAEIKRVVDNIDIQSKQVCIEALFMELSDSAIKQLGIRWDSLAEFGVGLSAGPFSSSKTINHEKSRTDSLKQADNRNSSDNLDKKYDMYGAPYQRESVNIVERPDGSFVETTSKDPTRQVTDAIDLSRNAESDVKDVFTKTINESQAAILNVDEMKVVLSALKKTDGISIVSNPKMIVSNGATNAFFRVGSREPIVKKTRQTGTTDSPGDTFTTELDTGIETDYIKGGYLHTGIELKVIPTVKTDDLIEALIEPSLRRETGQKVVGDNSWPIISVKEIKTRFTLESGQTVAIGGLTDTTDEKATSKIPLLGDIPLIGKYLFSHTKDVKSQTETIIFVTLAIANPKEIESTVAIPDRARLVHKRIIQEKIDKCKFDSEMNKLNIAADKEIEHIDKKSSPEKNK